jgi:hypothetical protein
VVCCSQAVHRSYARAIPGFADKSSVIHDAIDIEQTFPYRADARRALGLPLDVPIVGTIGRFTDHRSSPIQVFDYLAAGKPVVSSPVAQFEAWPSLVSIARGAQGFAAALDEALGVDSVEKQEQRRQFARQQSWDVRVSTALAVIDQARRNSLTEDSGV